MDFISIMVGLFVLGWVVKKIQAGKQAAARKQWMEQQRLLPRQVHVGELIEPENGPAYSHSQPAPRPNWKVQAAKIGAKVLIGALIGQHHRHHRHHDHDA